MTRVNCLLILLTFMTAAQAADTPDYLSKISNSNDFKALSTSGNGDLVRGGRTVKFLVDIRNKQKPQVYFMNGNRFPYHYFFALERLAGVTRNGQEFNRITYFTPQWQARQFLAGTFQTYTEKGDASGEKTFYGIHFYPQDVLREDMIVNAMTILRAAIDITIPFVFVSYGNQQSLRPQDQSSLQALKVPYTSIREILKDTPFIPMIQGETKGVLRYLELGTRDPDYEALTKTDIAVFEELPLDLAVVAGVITSDVQDSGSHVYLKSKERKTPDLVLRDQKVFDQVKALDGKPVHFIVSSDGFRIDRHLRVITMDEVNKFHPPSTKPWVKQPIIEEKKVLPFTEMCAAKASECLKGLGRFGGKASKLGFLNHKILFGPNSRVENQLGYPVVPTGFGLPLTYYKLFTSEKENKDLALALKDFIAKEKAGLNTDGKARIQKLKDIQELFYLAKFPKELETAVRNAITNLISTVRSIYKTDLRKVKVRSSANAEDQPGFDGAGLHSSYGAKMEGFTDTTSFQGSCKKEGSGHSGGGGEEVKDEMEPNSVACAIKGVYASLWNKRAVDERSFQRIDHETSAMGLAIHHTYGFLEKDFGLDVGANSVVITRAVNSEGAYGYTISTQFKNNLVTNPDSQTSAEQIFATFIGENEPIGFTNFSFAVPKAGSPELPTQILSNNILKQLIDVIKTAEETYCINKPEYYFTSACNYDLQECGKYSNCTTVPRCQMRQRPDMSTIEDACQYALIDPKKPIALDIELKYLVDQKEIDSREVKFIPYEKARFLIKQLREFSGK